MFLVILAIEEALMHSLVQDDWMGWKNTGGGLGSFYGLS